MRTYLLKGPDYKLLRGGMGDLVCVRFLFFFFRIPLVMEFISLTYKAIVLKVFRCNIFFSIEISLQDIFSEITHTPSKVSSESKLICKSKKWHLWQKRKTTEIKREERLNWVFCSTTKQDTRKQFMLIYASVRWRSAGYVLRVVEPLILFTREYSKHYYSFNLTISAVILLGFTQR